jgi:ABC-type tungstate transport system permease subunit
MAKKAYLVMPRTTSIVDTGLQTSKGKLKFKKGKTSMMVSDAALASEIDTEYGRRGKNDVWVAEDQRAESFLRDDGPVGVGVHRYFWGSSRRYAVAWDEFIERRKIKERTNNGTTDKERT